MSVRYDFDRDGFITAEDVRLLLSYIPFRKSKPGCKQNESEIKLGSEETREGLYDEAEGRNLDFKQRSQNQDEIKQFLNCTFTDELKTMSLEEFIHFNSDISSEMFVSVMAIFNERLPCSQFYFR